MIRSKSEEKEHYDRPIDPQMKMIEFHLLWQKSRTDKSQDFCNVILKQHRIAYGVKPLGYYWTLTVHCKNPPDVFDPTDKVNGMMIKEGLHNRYLVHEVTKDSKYKEYIVVSNFFLYDFLRVNQKYFHLNHREKTTMKNVRKYLLLEKPDGFEKYDLDDFLRQYDQENSHTIPAVVGLLEKKCENVKDCEKLYEKMVKSQIIFNCTRSMSRRSKTPRSSESPIYFSRMRNIRICDNLKKRKKEINDYLKENTPTSYHPSVSSRTPKKRLQYDLSDLPDWSKRSIMEKPKTVPRQTRKITGIERMTEILKQKGLDQDDHIASYNTPLIFKNGKQLKDITDADFILATQLLTLQGHSYACKGNNTIQCKRLIVKIHDIKEEMKRKNITIQFVDVNRGGKSKSNYTRKHNKM